MRKKIVLLYGHPDPSPERLCHAIMETYAQAAKDAGHEVIVLEIAKMEYGSVISHDDFKNIAPPKDILKAQSDIEWADHITLIYPLWMGSLPGLFKMFLEQVLRPGFAMDYSGGGMPKKLMKGNSADIIVTMGMPVVFYNWFFFAHSLKNLKRNVLGFVGIGPIRCTLFGNVESPGPKKHEKMFSKIQGLARNP